MTATAPDFGSKNYIDTYYSRTLSGAAAYAPLGDTVKTDVCVIGGGLAGLSTALGLLERKRHAVVVEAGRIGGQASGRNGGFVAKGYAAGEGVLAAKLGDRQARDLIQLTRVGRHSIRNRINTYGIDCGPLVNGVLTVSWREKTAEMQAKVADMNKRFGLDLEFWPRERVRAQCITERYYDGIYSPNDFQFHPLNYVHGLARAITGLGGGVYEQSRAVKIEKVPGGYVTHTAGGRVESKEVVLCCSIDVNGLDKRLSNAAFPILTFIMVTKPVDADRLAGSLNTRHAIYDTRFSSDYYRVLPDRRIMWGGRVALKDNPQRVAQWLLSDLLKVYPQLEGHVEPEMAWSGRLCYAAHKMPQIGRLEDGYWYCTCFGGHGLVPTTIGGEIVASAIADNDQRYHMFRPFGLKDDLRDFGGGGLAPYVAQSVYYWWRFRDMAGF